MATRSTKATPETAAQTAPETAEVPAEAPTNGKATRRMPNYTTDFSEGLDELPEEAPSGRKLQYFNQLTELAANGEPGKWYELSHFYTATGATNAFDALTGKTKKDGTLRYPKTQIPAGDWEFRAIKVPGTPGTTGKDSKLFARLNG